MKKKAMSFQIMLWAEGVIAVRILLFAIPVFLYKASHPSGSLSVDDWFLMALGVSSVFFLIAAIMTILGSSLWRMLHFLVVGVAAVVGVSLVAMVFRTQSPFHIYYLTPLALAAIVLGYLLRLNNPVDA